MLVKWLSRIEKVYVARTVEELQAIYRFRYTIYVEELKRQIGGVDHKRRMVHDEEDEKEGAVHLYAGTVDEIIGTLRIRIWEPGTIPDYDFKTFSLELFPGIEKMRVAELGRVMISRTIRGRLVLLSMMQEAYHLLAGKKKVDLTFLYCRPGLVRYYRKFGARPYSGRLVDAPEGMEIPMVVVLSDHRYFNKIGSPVAPLVKKYFGPGKRKPLDLSHFKKIFDNELLPVETDPQLIWDRLQHDFIQEQEKPKAASFVDSLSKRTLKKLSDYGFIMDIPTGTLVTREGHVEKEMYIILEGTFEVFTAKRVFAILEKGDLFGEVAFFRESGKRSASVRALTDGKLLVLRRNLMKELSKSDPKTAYTILFNLGRILSERLASTITRV
ncbi:MAG: cyclic nucleotide-binding domain-containing protein [Deltaproteobacteria bacterium]|nr:cyclic nucleotide-binding domain-containing protein [Deltaproteobacteria bacterium]